MAVAASLRDQALSLLAAANKHRDLAVKISSLKQAKYILLSMDASLASELVPHFVQLQFSPESLVRKLLVEVIEEIGFKAVEHSSILMSVLLTLLRDDDAIVTKQSIVSGTNIFRSVLEEMTVQSQQNHKVESGLEETWMWMLKFKDAVFGIALEPGSVGVKLLALKFLETFVLLFTSDTCDPEKSVREGSRQFNISWLVGGHAVLDPVVLMLEANRTLHVLLNLLQSADSIPGCLTITVVNCLAAIARKRPQHYDTVFSALLDFDPAIQTIKGCHADSIQYSLRTAFLGFLRCPYSPIVESRERLIRTLQVMNAGDAADQVIQQADKLMKNSDRSTCDAQVSKDDHPSTQPRILLESSRKRSVFPDYEQLANGHGTISKRIRTGPDPLTYEPIQINDSGNGLSLNGPVLDSGLTAVEQMVALVGTLVAEGERGSESLETFISKIQPDLFADIVIANMKHLPKTPPSAADLGNISVAQELGSHDSQAHDACCPDPRSVTVTSGGAVVSPIENTNTMQSEPDDSVSISNPISLPVMTDDENTPVPLPSKIRSDEMIVEGPSNLGFELLIHKNDNLKTHRDVNWIPEVNASREPLVSPVDVKDDDMSTGKVSLITETNGTDSSSVLESDQFSPDVPVASVSDCTCLELPLLPPYVEISKEQENDIKHMAIRHIIGLYKCLDETDYQKICMPLLARLAAQINDDNEFTMVLQKQILDDQRQKGHELVLHVLYHLYSLMILDAVENASSTAVLYENFLSGVAKSLLNSFPASDRSFSRLLGEVPFLPESTLKVLNDLCYSDIINHHGKIVRDIERVTQGLGAIWSLILQRPQNRQACLGIALKCAIHPQDEIRAKAIRLVANKLYLLIYISEDIEKFATKMLLSAVDQPVSDAGLSQSGPTEQRAEAEVESQVAAGTSRVLETTTSKTDSTSVAKPMAPSVSDVSLSEAQRLISLFFALCTKKPSLLRIVFNVYGRATRTVKQVFHRHIPILVRALRQAHSELLCIISDPPQGSENLGTMVLQILIQETMPFSDLIATVKHLYKTKLRDVTILVPFLSSLSKEEVLPIFPQLVDLPLEKFQMALAHILQGSAHTGPALTPVEVLIAIHGIVPERDGLALKKIIDACSACFEQHTVFTQQVLAKALNQMVDQTPLPLLFMRTVIQAVDTFPALVDFVMEILSKLVAKQVWRMPKLWVGFLKCVYQTQPQSFHVLLQLPPPQLENALNKHANLKGPLAAYANQPAVKSSLTRSTLAVLGLANK